MISSKNNHKAIPTDQGHETGESLTVLMPVHTLNKDSLFSFERTSKTLSHFVQHRRPKLAGALLLCGASLVLSGCGFSWPDWAVVNSDPLGFLTSEDRAAEPPPAPQNSPLSLDSQYDPLVNAQPLQLQPGGPLGSLGLNLDLYFDPGITDSDTRIDRLERAVIALHRDLQSIAPQLQGLGSGSVLPTAAAPPPPVVSTPPAPVAAVTSALTPSNSKPVVTTSAQQASANTAPTSLFTNQTPAQLTTTNNNTTFSAPTAPRGLAPMPGVSVPRAPAQPVVSATPPVQNPAATSYQTASIPPPAPPPTGTQTSVNQGPRDVKNGSNAMVSGIRVGQHPDKVRVVFDVTKKTSYSADLDNGENILVVEMPDAKWKTPTTYESFGTLPVVKSYKVEPFNDGAGNLFILQLKKNTQILMQGKFPALSGGGERIVIDLKK